MSFAPSSTTMTESSRKDLEETLDAVLKIPNEAGLRFALTHAYFLGALDGYDRAAATAKDAIRSAATALTPETPAS